VGKIVSEKGISIIETQKSKGSAKVKRTVHYKQGYKVIICGKFYEVAEGRRLLHFGELKHKPTLQEVWNKTIGLQEMENEKRQ